MAGNNYNTASNNNNNINNQPPPHSQSNVPQYNIVDKSDSATPNTNLGTPTNPTSTAVNSDAENTSTTPSIKISEDRASSIGWFFIKSYYDFFVSKLDEIHKIYHPKASVIHDSFPKSLSKDGDDGSNSDEKEEDSLPSVFKANGLDSIKKCFQMYNGDESVKNRIVITSACFQVSMDENIIIVTFGEWSKNDSPFKQFSQTFVLVPGKSEKTYDVSNDILRFIESNGYKENGESNHPTVQVSKTQKNGNENPKEAKDDFVTASSENTQLDNVEAEGLKDDTKSDSKQDESKNAVEPTEASSKDETSDLKQESKLAETPEQKDHDLNESVKSKENADSSKGSTISENEKPKEDNSADGDKEELSKAAPATSNTGMTWADLANQAVPASSTTLSKTAPTTAHSSTTKSSTTSKKAGTSSSTNATSSASTNTASSNGKFRKEDWFPIYIRGIRQLDEKTLKQHLSKTFGDLKFFKVNQNIALCDFVDQEAQKKALSVKETTLDGVTFNLEPRESKTGNNYHSHVKKFVKEKDNNSKDISSKDKFEKVENRRSSTNNNSFNGKKPHTSSKKTVKQGSK